MIDKKLLYKLYIEDKKNEIDIAKTLGVSRPTVYHYLKKFNISKKDRIKPALLYKLYVKERKSCSKISRVIGYSCRTIYRRFKEFNIPRSRINRVKIDKDLLYKLYIEKKKSGYEIAKILDISYQSIYYYLKKFNIPRRSASEVNRGKHYSQRKSRKCYHPKTEFKKGIHYSPKTEFKKGHKETPEIREKRIRNSLKACHHKPNKKEKELYSMLQFLFPNEYSINVNGEIMILGNKVPDFVNTNGQKKVIELYGDYWHRNDKEEDRINYFKKFGYNTLIVWEHELKNKDF